MNSKGCLSLAKFNRLRNQSKSSPWSRLLQWIARPLSTKARAANFREFQNAAVNCGFCFRSDTGLRDQQARSITQAKTTTNPAALFNFDPSAKTHPITFAAVVFTHPTATPPTTSVNLVTHVPPNHSEFQSTPIHNPPCRSTRLPS